MWSDKVSLKFASQAEWEALGLENGHTFDAVVLGTFTREDGTESAGFHVDCRCKVNQSLIGAFEINGPCLTVEGAYAGPLPEAIAPYWINPQNERHTYA